jgi:ribosome biogenesis GTPase A
MFLLLQEGIVIIDTPGIGTSKEMTERIQQYLANAFGCIYVINSASAGEVQEGRVRYNVNNDLHCTSL